MPPKPVKRTPAEELALVRRIKTIVEGMIDDPTDRQVVFDTLEGIEDVDRSIARLVDLSNDLAATCGAKKERAKQYNAAAEADLANRRAVGKIIHLILIECRQKSWSGIEGGAHIRPGSLSVEITDATQIGFAFLKPVPDVKLIGEHIKAHGRKLTDDEMIKVDQYPTETWVSDDIPGAKMVRGPTTIAIHKPKAAGTSTEEGPNGG